MTTFTGERTGSFGLGGSGSTAPGFADMVFNRAGSMSLLPSGSGPLTLHRPVGAPGRTFSGERAEWLRDNFYNRIIIEPGRLDLGNLLSDQTRRLFVWNSYFTAKDVTDFTVIGGDGITITTPATPVYELLPLQQVAYDLTISTAGPADIAATLEWVIGGSTYAVDITGRRLIVFAIKPNWAAPVTESLEWKTDVLRAFDGSEQRRALADRPRQELSYQFLVANDDAAYLDRLLWGWQNRMFAVPRWQHPGKLTAAAGEGSAVVYLDTSTIDFVPGASVLLYEALRRTETAEIAEVHADRLVLMRGLRREWPAGSPVYPVLLAQLQDDISLQRATASVQSGVVSFTASPETNDPGLPAVSAPVTYRGLEVLLTGPNWRDGIAVQAQLPTGKLDTGTGAISWSIREIYPRRTRRYPWLLKNRQDALAFRAFLARMKGSLKTCWVPSGHQDFRVLTDIPSGGEALTVAGSEYGDLVSVSAMFKHVILKLVDGQTLIREIYTATADPVDDTTTLMLDESFTEAIAVSDIQMCSLLTRCRLGSDKIEIPWETAAVAAPTISFTTTPE